MILSDCYVYCYLQIVLYVTQLSFLLKGWIADICVKVVADIYDTCTCSVAYPIERDDQTHFQLHLESRFSRCAIRSSVLGGHPFHLHCIHAPVCTIMMYYVYIGHSGTWRVCDKSQCHGCERITSVV